MTAIACASSSNPARGCMRYERVRRHESANLPELSNHELTRTSLRATLATAVKMDTNAQGLCLGGHSVFVFIGVHSWFISLQGDIHVIESRNQTAADQEGSGL